MCLPPFFVCHPKLHVWFESCISMYVGVVECRNDHVLLIVLIGVTMETIIRNFVVSHLVMCVWVARWCSRGRTDEKCLSYRIIYWNRSWNVVRDVTNEVRSRFCLIVESIGCRLLP